MTATEKHSLFYLHFFLDNPLKLYIALGKRDEVSEV